MLRNKHPNLVGVLFVMTIDSARSTTPFASIIDVSSSGSREDEVLFSMHTVFRIRAITCMGQNHRVFQVELTLTDDNDKDFRDLIDRIRKETFPNSTEWYRLGLVLLQMGQPVKAQRVYEILREQETEESAKAPLYDLLGTIKADLGEYEEAIGFYEKALAIRQQSLPSNHPDLATSYNNIGVVYRDMGDYPKALSFYEKGLAIQQQSVPPNHPHLASSYGNIGSVYGAMLEYSKALPYFEKAHGIQQQSLLPNHLALAVSHYNMGLSYENIGKYSKACASYERAVHIGQLSLPSNHPHLQIYQRVLANIKKKL